MSVRLGKNTYVESHILIRMTLLEASSLLQAAQEGGGLASTQSRKALDRVITRLEKAIEAKIAYDKRT